MRPSATVLIADDEEAPRAQLAAALATAWPEAHCVATCMNGVDAWDAFLEHEPTVCLLDIRMPGLTGIEVAQRIGARAHVVFVTAWADHAVAAFDAGAVDYVLKPVDSARLARALERVQARVASALAVQPAAGEPGGQAGYAGLTRHAVPPAGMASTGARLGASTPPADPATLQALLAQLAAQVQRPAPLTVIQAGLGKEVRLIRVDEVVYFESDTRYTRVVWRSPGTADTPAQDAEALIRTPLKELLVQLDPNQFWQVHRSVIVAQRHIEAAVRVDEHNMQLRLRGRSERLPVSRHFQGLFKGQ